MIRKRRTEELLVALALGKFRRRPPLKACPLDLHRKETFLAPDHPLNDKFAKLTKQEEQHGFLDETSTFETCDGWQTRLVETGYRLAGHRLIRRKS